ncbi:MAG: aminoacyl-tRNA hydrolase [Gammaproteobacteria bacterium]|nr:aminoacyl-tRNA hydrolase [Gammaproteobacteria bacterium]
MLSSKIALIVGLGNPGVKYEQTRHNVGFWFIDGLANAKGVMLRNEAKFQGESGKITIDDQVIGLLKPMGYMNHSGQSLAAVANYYKTPLESILVVHDELDLPPGTLRLKSGGGHGGHNGLRDIIAHSGGNAFMRLRIGIGHPGSSRDVTNYVLGLPGNDEKLAITSAIDEALITLPQIVAGEYQKVMNHLHTVKEIP